MANKRMFSVDVVENDAFLSLPLKVQALYFHLGIHGDDDGFVASPMRIARSINCTRNDLKQLENSGFVILFESGVLVISDWKVNNTLRNQRYKPTTFQNEFAKLVETANKRYALIDSGTPSGVQMETTGIPNGYQLDTQHNVTQQNITKPNETEPSSTEQSQQQPTAPPAAVAPHKGALGGSTVLGSKTTERDSETEAARQRFLNSIKRPAWPAADAAAPDVMKEDEES